MRRRQTAEPTVDELIATLKNSYYPTLIVEGDGDYIAFRDYEIENVEWGLTVLPVNGKTKVLGIIERRSEISNPNLVFLIDRDCWIFSGVPESLNRPDIILTDGYSIENDILRDGPAGQFLKGHERIMFETELSSACRFFRVAAWRHVLGEVFLPLSTSPHVFLNNLGGLNPATEAELVEIEDHVPEEYSIVHADPHKYLRGKLLLALYLRQLNRDGRRAKYSGPTLLEISATARGPLLQQIESHVTQKLHPEHRNS